MQAVFDKIRSITAGRRVRPQLR